MAAQASLEVGRQPIAVTLLLYSGRMDPTFVAGTGSAEHARIADLLRRLMSSATKFSEPVDLSSPPCGKMMSVSGTFNGNDALVYLDSARCILAFATGQSYKVDDSVFRDVYRELHALTRTARESGRRALSSSERSQLASKLATGTVGKAAR